ncbi:MAG: glycogen debranching enzyme, partial [Spirochaetota bacterium]
MTVRPGKPRPLGATVTEDGVQFAAFSRNATAVTLLFFDDPQAARPAHEIALDPERNRTGDVWHVEVAGVGAGQLYLFHVDGPYDPERGHRFNRNLFLIDPYARALTGGFRWNLAGQVGYNPDSPEGDLSRNLRTDLSAGEIPKCVVVDDTFDWQGDKPLNYPLRKSVIYEAHVKGLSADPSSGAEFPGTYRGVIEMIPHLKRLGITSLELLPVHEFDEYELERVNPLTGDPLRNYWGYSTLSFFAPKASYAIDGSAGGQVAEFKEMVR